MPRMILVVDNEENVVNDIIHVFENLNDDNYRLITTLFGQDAMDIINARKIDLVITAIDIDDIDGLDIIKVCRKKRIPVIVLTSRVDEETIGMIKAYYKPHAYLNKPLKATELINNVRSIFMQKADKIEGIPNSRMGIVLRVLCDSIEQGITIIDRDFNVVWINKALENKGFKAKEVMGCKSYKVFDNRDGPQENSPTLKTFKDGKINKIVKKGSDGHEYRMTSVPVKGDQGKVIYVIEYGEDLGKK